MADFTELRLDGPAVRHEVDYDVNGNVIYEGYANPGTLTSDSRWFILRHAYNVSNQFLKTQSARDVIYDNRASISYT